MASKVPVVPEGTRKDDKIYLQINVISVSKGQEPVYQSRFNGDVYVLVLTEDQKNQRPEIGDFDWFEVVLAGNTTREELSLN